MAKVEHVISGDNLVIFVELCMDDLYKKVRVRLHGVDTPDAYKATPDTEAGKVRDLVRQMVLNSTCSVKVVSQSRKGWIVVLSIHKGEEVLNLNQFLMDQGYIFREKTNVKNQKKEYS